MKSDFWTRGVLTLIALSLAVIAWKLPMSGTSYAQIGLGCGAYDKPCYISAGEIPFHVSVQPPSDPNTK
jgi:hypothetical protein